MSASPTINIATLTVAGEKLFVAWTNAGVAYVESASPARRREMRRRMKVEFEEARLPAIIRSALAAAARGRDDGVPIDLTWARDYERDVLLAARTIPWGQTRPYSWLAREARRPLAVRAAASIIANNPLWRLVPCHRVIYKDGRLGPFGSSGAARKRALLRREGVIVPRPAR